MCFLVNFITTDSFKCYTLRYNQRMIFLNCHWDFGPDYVSITQFTTWCSCLGANLNRFGKSRQPTCDPCVWAADSLDRWVGRTSHKKASVAPACGCHKTRAFAWKGLLLLGKGEMQGQKSVYVNLSCSHHHSQYFIISSTIIDNYV